jgi:hypothetical protein
MHAIGPIEAERPLQHVFRKASVFSHLMLLALIGLFAWWLDGQPDQLPLPQRTAALQFKPVRLEPARFAPLRLAGAWRVTADDPRFGGVSALAIDKGGMIAVTDAGTVIRFAPPVGDIATAEIKDLPDGPRRPGYKRNRDAEALARDPAGRGWWVAFENYNQLWLYNRDFTRALERIDFGRRRWPRNKGIEAMVADPGGPLLLPEAGETVIRIQGARMRSTPLANPMGRLSDAVRLSDGRTMLIARRASFDGFYNALVPLLPGDRLGRPIPLGLGSFDNAEALAAEPIPNGTRLWLMTDDNFSWPMRTLLVALDLPSAPPTPVKPN